jgi:hypothetical protein
MSEKKLPIPTWYQATIWDYLGETPTDARSPTKQLQNATSRSTRRFASNNVKSADGRALRIATSDTLRPRMLFPQDLIPEMHKPRKLRKMPCKKLTGAKASAACNA